MNDRIFDKDGNVRDAGAIVFREKDGIREFLLVYRHTQDDYSFPKGRVEKGESSEQTAIRETEEETGYKIELLGKLEPVYYNYPEGGGVAVEMFEGKIVGDGKKIETNEEVAWTSEEDVPDTLTYSNLQEHFARYLEEHPHD